MIEKTDKREIKYLVTEDYIKKVVKVFLFDRHYKSDSGQFFGRFLQILLLALVLFGQAGLYLMSTQSGEFFFFTITLPYIIFIFIYTIGKWSIKKNVTFILGGVGGEGTIIFLDDCVNGIHGGFNTKIKYDVIEKAVITKNVILLIFKNGHSSYIPAPTTKLSVKLTKKYIENIIDQR